MPNTVADTRHHAVGRSAAASASRASASAAAASSSASSLVRHSTTAPTPNSTATATLTTRSGSRLSNRPATTAMTICSVSADAAPIHTGSGRLKRADSTIVASIVLSGSSATKIVANAVTMVAGCTVDHSTGRGRRRARSGSVEGPDCRSDTPSVQSAG